MATLADTSDSEETTASWNLYRRELKGLDSFAVLAAHRLRQINLESRQIPTLT